MSDSRIFQQSERLAVTEVSAEPRCPSRAGEGVAPCAQVAGPPQLQGTVCSGEASRPRGSAEPGAIPLAGEMAVATGTTRSWRRNEGPARPAHRVPRARCSTNTNRDTKHVRTVSSSASPKGKHARSEKYSTLPKSAFIKVNKSSEYSLPKPNERWPLPARLAHRRPAVLLSVTTVSEGTISVL